MRNTFLSLLLVVATAAQAQDPIVQGLKNEAGREVKRDAADTLPGLWRKGGLFSANLSLGSLSNWAAGGDESSLSQNTLLSLYAFYKRGKHTWDNTLDLNYGIVRTTSLGSRKNDDRLDLLSKYGQAIGPKWNVAALANFRTQFFKGYTYKDNIRTLSSSFLSPAYLLMGVGFDYKPTSNFSVYLSPLTARWTFVQNDSLSAKGAYGVTPGKESRSELGAFVSASYLKVFSPMLSYKGRMDLFSNYKRNPQNIDLYMTNLLSVNLTRVLAVTWNVDLIYDDDVRLFGPAKTSAALQVKSIVGVGLMVKMGSSKGK